MPKPLSNDIRIRVVQAYEFGDVSYREVAARFDVAFNSVVRWVSLFRSKGDVSPRGCGGNCLPKIRDVHLDALKALIKAKVERENITLAGLLGPDGIKSLYPYAGSFDGERYLSHLENHLLPCLTAGDFVVMDNLRMRHIPAAKKMFHDAEIELIFLPPYSPEYNPIEEAWSLIKSVLKKK